VSRRAASTVHRWTDDEPALRKLDGGRQAFVARGVRVNREE
jgi:hypothetical protein